MATSGGAPPDRFCTAPVARLLAHCRALPILARVTSEASPDESQLGFPLEVMGGPMRISSHVVRLELNALLDQAKAARDAAPWDRATNRRYRESVTERAKVLPPEEAEFLRRQFVLEFDRIELLLAA